MNLHWNPLRHTARCQPMLLAAVLLAPTFGARAELPDTIARIKPAIVAVGTYAKLRSPPFKLRGTGFAVGDGTLIATNAHVVPTLGAQESEGTEESETLAVALRGEGKPQLRMATLLARDSEHDLALLRIQGTPLPVLKVGASETVREGQSIAFTGFPIGGALGLSPVTHRGVISAITPIVLPGGNAGELKDVSIRRLRSSPFPIYQLDATAYPGNSGGPMYDADTGEVLGILNMVFVKESKEAVLEKPSGISYAIPASFLVELLKRPPL